MYPWELAEQSIIDGSSGLVYHSKEESKVMTTHTHTYTHIHACIRIHNYKHYGGREVDMYIVTCIYHSYIPGHPFCIQ